MPCQPSPPQRKSSMMLKTTLDTSSISDSELSDAPVPPATVYPSSDNSAALDLTAAAETNNALHTGLRRQRIEHSNRTMCVCLYLVAEHNSGNTVPLTPQQLFEKAAKYELKYYDLKAKRFRQRGPLEISWAWAKLAKKLGKSSARLCEGGSSEVPPTVLESMGYGSELPWLLNGISGSRHVGNHPAKTLTACSSVNNASGEPTDMIQQHTRRSRRSSNGSTSSPNGGRGDGLEEWVANSTREPDTITVHRTDGCKHAGGPSHEAPVTSGMQAINLEPQSLNDAARGVRLPLLIDRATAKMQMQDVYSSLKSLIHEHMSAQHVDLAGCSFFARDAEPILESLYAVVTETDAVWVNRAHAMRHMSCYDLFVSLMGAFAHKQIFSATGLSSFTTMERLFSTGFQGFITDFESELCRHNTNIDAVLRQVYLRHIQREEVQHEELAKPAQSLAFDLSLALHCHLLAQLKWQDIARPSALNFEQFVLVLAQHLSEILRRALKLKCELSAAKEDVQWLWFTPGNTFNGRFMEAVHSKGVVVVATLFPGLAISVNGVLTAVFQAQVIVRD